VIIVTVLLHVLYMHKHPISVLNWVTPVSSPPSLIINILLL